MNKKELKAMLSIAKKLDWNGKPVTEVIESINQMVMNYQATMMDCTEDCVDKEIALEWLSELSAGNIVSNLYIWDYESLVGWEHFCSLMGIDGMTLHTLMVCSDQYNAAVAELYETEDEEYLRDEQYETAMMEEITWYNHARQMGWE